jgi:hypothetical protein
LANNKLTTGVTNGIIHPSLDDVKKVVDRLQTELQKDPAIAQEFEKNPREVLGSMGLNGDVQRELLQDAGIAVPAPLLRCWVTCWFTRCVITVFKINPVVPPRR